MNRFEIRNLNFLTTNHLCSLKESHTGEYLAQVIAECLKRFGIAEMVR